MGDEGEQVNLWESILNEARADGGGEEESGKTLVVLGDERCGKTSLIARLKGVDFDLLPNCLALDYTYMDMVVEEDEEYVSLGKVNVWQLSGEPHFGSLLNVALKAAGGLDNVAFMVCVALDKPWTMAAAVERWLQLIAKVVGRAEEDGSGGADGREERRARVEEAWRRYSEPEGGERADGGGTDGGEAGEAGASSGAAADDEGEEVLMPLTEGAFEVNVGVPVVIAVCKADFASELQAQYAYKDAHFDYIQQALRRTALAHGAALFYTSAAQEGNTRELLDYFLAVFYGRPFAHRPQVVEKEAVLVPAGWDTLSKIEVLSESSRVLTRNKAADDGGEPAYEAVIKEPFSALGGSMAGAAADSVEAEDDQEFLQRFREFIDADPAGASDAGQISKGLSDLLSAGKKKTQTAALVDQSKGRRPSLENILAGAKGSGPASAGGTPTSEGSEEVLSSFFSSLMAKGGASSGTADSRADVKKVLGKE